MSQGFFAAISGIKASQTKIDVISDNIANMNTTGFKSSQVNFETIFSRTLSSGSAPGSNTGGTNPIQIGLGTTISEISRNFTSGSVQTTNKDTDMYISGSGFFTLRDPQGGIILSRAGNFKLDEAGNLVNPKGYKVLGTDSSTGSAGSTTTIKIPDSLSFTENEIPITDAGTDPLSGLNTDEVIENSSFTVVTSTGTADITINASGTIQDAVAAINAQSDTTGVTAAIDNATGGITLTSNEPLTYTNVTGNFLGQTGLYVNDTSAGGAGPYTYTGNVLGSISVDVSPGGGSGSSAYTGFSVSADGAIEVSYAGGVKISVTGDPREIVYSSSGKLISGDSLNISNNAVRPEELQIQMANVINPAGLVAQAGNTFTIGPNAGDAVFGFGNSGGNGEIKTGGLEASNVDLPSEFADMILAQRGVDANGRTFDTQNQILRTIVNLGR